MVYNVIKGVFCNSRLENILERKNNNNNYSNLVNINDVQDLFMGCLYISFIVCCNVFKSILRNKKQ